MVYNLTNLSTSQGVPQAFVAFNELSGGILGYLIILTLFVIVMIGVQAGPRYKYATASFTSFIGSTLLLAAGLFSNVGMWAASINLGISIVLLYWSRN